MMEIRRRTTAVAALVTLVALAAACVHVPDSIKAEFRAAEPDERSNYQPALHGTAPPAEASDPWSRYHAALDAGAPDAAPARDTDADAPTPDDASAPAAPRTVNPGDIL